jgi:hypothetical protein
MCLVGHNGWAGPAGRHGASAARGVLHIGRVGWEGSCRRWPSPAPFRTSAVPAAGAAPVKACPVSTVPETRRAGPGERWPGGPDRRTGSIATHQREPTTKVPRGASLGPRKISIGPARHRPAACGIARPQRAKSRGLRGSRCAAVCPGRTRPRRPVATTGPARPSRGPAMHPGHGRAERQLWQHRTLVDRGSAQSAPGRNCLAVTGPLDPETGHVVSSSGQRDRTAGVRPRGATQPRT